MTKKNSLADLRREYGALHLSENEALAHPLDQFQIWFDEALATENYDPTAMVLSTVDEGGLPDARVVLLKGIESGHFIFYTNYKSAKSRQLESAPYAALNFYWPAMARQVRIRGKVERTSEEASDHYFSSRPLKSQYSAVISPQSQPIENRHLLEERLDNLIQQQSPVSRPDYWGGFAVIPEEFEFWQGRDNRLHDRIHYYRAENAWLHERLGP